MHAPCRSALSACGGATPRRHLRLRPAGRRIRPLPPASTPAAEGREQRRPTVTGTAAGAPKAGPGAMPGRGLDAALSDWADRTQVLRPTQNNTRSRGLHDAGGSCLTATAVNRARAAEAQRPRSPIYRAAAHPTAREGVTGPADHRLLAGLARRSRLRRVRDRRGRRFKSGHPDRETAGHKASSGLRFVLHIPGCPILGARWERTQITVGR
jgi:hypothetical protein